MVPMAISGSSGPMELVRTVINTSRAAAVAPKLYAWNMISERLFTLPRRSLSQPVATRIPHLRPETPRSCAPRCSCCSLDILGKHGGVQKLKLSRIISVHYAKDSRQTIAGMRGCEI